MSAELNWAISGPEFEAFVQRHRQQLAMVHFWADWNPLDPGMFQVFEEVYQAVGNEIAMARVQVGPPDNAELCRWLGIVQVPTVLFLFRNQIIDVKVGFSKNRLVAHVQMLMHSCYSAGPELMPMPLIPERLSRREPPFGTRQWTQPESGPAGVPTMGVPTMGVPEPIDENFTPPPDGAEPGQEGPSRAFPISAGFGVPYRPGPADQMSALTRPAMRFGIYAPQPTAPAIAARQKKSWLARWLGLD